jgi:hypothetical protein
MASDRRPYPPIFDCQFWSDAPLLKFPVKKGESWSHSDRDGTFTRLIEATDETVSVPARMFDRCVRVKTTAQLRTANEGSPQADETYNRSTGFREGEKWMWFAPGVGIVKAEHHHANGKRTVVELTGYHLAGLNTGFDTPSATQPAATPSKGLSDAYFPLAIGNWWKYEWRNESGELLFKEQGRVVLEREGWFYLACSGYTTNRAEYGE